MAAVNVSVGTRWHHNKKTARDGDITRGHSFGFPSLVNVYLHLNGMRQ